MAKKKYLCVMRSQPKPPGENATPTPAMMEQMYAKFNAWKEKFQDDIVDMGGKLGNGKVVTTEAITDGPFAEVKEVIGGYMIVTAETIDMAVEIARESPGVFPGSSVEVREITTS